jgi:hypothetical protein
MPWGPISVRATFESESTALAGIAALAEELRRIPGSSCAAISEDHEWPDSPDDGPYVIIGSIEIDEDTTENVSAHGEDVAATIAKLDGCLSSDSFEA